MYQQIDSPPTSLKSKAINGVGWSATDAFLGQGVTFLVSLVLARLLSPSEFGIIGIATILIAILTGFVDCGFSNALIRKKDVSGEDYNTMFITNVGMSIVIYAIIFVISPIIAGFFQQQEVTNILRVLSLIIIIQSVSLVQQTILTKHINFKAKAKATVISATLSGILGITAASCGYGVWALVVQQLSANISNTICICIICKWTPNFKFHLDSFRQMWTFGWKIMLSTFIDRVWNELHQTVVGKWYTPAALGQYSRAKIYAHFLSSNFTLIIQRVSYPVLSEIQDDKEKLVYGYRKIIKLSMFVTVVCLIPLGAISEPFVYCMIGNQWEQAASFLPLMCIYMSLYPLHSINLEMLQVEGRSDLFLKLEIIKKTIGLGPLCLGIFVDIYWMIAGSIITGFICFIINSHYSGKNLGYTSWQQFKDILPSYIIAFIIAISVYFIKYLPISCFIVLPIQLLVGSVVFFTICEKIKLEEYIEAKQLALKLLNQIRNGGKGSE